MFAYSRLLPAFFIAALAAIPVTSYSAASAPQPVSPSTRIHSYLAAIPDLLHPEATEGASGIITTYAGNGYAEGGYSGDGGAATAAEMSEPASVAVDAQGNLFIVDSLNDRIRRVDHATHIITTYAGGAANTYACEGNYLCGDGGPATSATLVLPQGVVVDASGNLYIADYGNNSVRKVNAQGVISTVAGLGLLHAGSTGDGGLATKAEVSGPYGVAVDAAGNVYIADTASSRIRKVTASTGIITTVAGGGSGCAGAVDTLGDGCPGPDASLTNPSQIVLDAAGNLYISDLGANNLIRVVNAKTQIVTIFAGNDDGNVCTASVDEWGDGCIAADTIFNSPQQLTFDATGDLYIGDAGHNLIRRIDGKTGIVTAVAGTGATGFTGTGGPATSAEFSLPYGVAFDPTGNMYIADLNNQVVRKVTYATAAVTATPTFSPAPGSYTATTNVTLADATSGAKIYYTEDGTTPTIPATGTTKLYAAAIPVSATTTIKAIALAGTDLNSAVSTGTYTLPKPGLAPVFSVATGTYDTVQSVKITDATAGAVIYYTLNGTTPTTASTKYSAAITVSATETIEAVAIASGYTESPVASARYTIEKQATAPIFSPAVGTYTTTETIIITDATPGAVIYYTINGTVPTSASTKYTAPVAITQSTTFEAIAIVPGYVNSVVASAKYTLIGWPTGITSPASAITTTTATLSAVVNDLGLAASYHFQYGTTSTTLTSTTAKTTLAASTAAVKATAALTGLKTKTTYHFQFVLTTTAGTITGPIQTFITN